MDPNSHKPLHIYFLPMMAPGHMIPAVHIARGFARCGAKSTIITTPSNASKFSETIEADRRNGSDISVSLVKFPCREAGLPDGCEDLSSTTTLEMSHNFLHALDLFRRPVEDILQQGDPDCLISGAFFSWSTAVARSLGIPRVVFYGTGFFPMCVFRLLREKRPQDAVASDSEEFEVPGLPDRVMVSRKQLPHYLKLKATEDDPLLELIRKVLEADEAGFGIVVNTFHELEPAYAAHYLKHTGKAWHIGPVSLISGGNGPESHDCTKWLGSRKPNSVVYVCFGSMAIVQKPQTDQIAAALEDTGQDFVWVVGKEAEVDEKFEARTEGRGMVIRGWAPQVQILSHAAVGGFVTHCGWNSLMEGVAAGVPMVTWPLSAEQFFNEKLVVEVLGTGVPVGAEEWSKRMDERAAIGREKIARAVGRLMVGEEGERMRRRARELGEVARRAVEEGGSSYADFDCLMEEIRMFRASSS
ncbi:UDP-glucose flavonoid 3-O-glucosyltransferase 7-like [Salvia splendens]|uniref:UDP-glucose flavonoid 3-O-glucosyltransferase 7-like n=1 Tax=Salvia splendens TaxID=180675 RepID=UPI001C255801|nr:UDP-glucose flavonoid 3-O-glucosyltransferase 7-like [Salvia splendens]